MDKYLDAERRLAELRGLTIHRITGDGLLWVGNQDGSKSFLAQPTRDNAAAFALMVEHDVWPHSAGIDRPDLIEVQRGAAYFDVLAEADVREHPSRMAAVRYAVVQAVICKLEEQGT